MAVRQYIGARYVPIYVGAWSALKTYEPLSIVTDGTGNSWTSRKVVPEGTPLEEGEFWAMTGVFSGQLLALDRRVTEAENEIQDTNQVVAEVNQAITAIREELDQIGFAMFLGDSYTAAAGLTEGERYPAHVSAALNLEYDNVAVGGSGFLPEARRRNVRQQFLTAWESYEEEKKKRLKYIFIAAGRNDSANFPNATQSEYDTEIQALYLAIHNSIMSAGLKIENVRIIIMPSWNRCEPIDNTRFSAYCKIMNALSSATPYINAEVIANTSTWMLGRGDCMLNDYAHYNAKGHVILANHILSVVNGNDFSIPDFHEFNKTLSSGAVIQLRVSTIQNVAHFQLIINTANASTQISANENMLEGVEVPEKFKALFRLPVIIAASNPRLNANEVETIIYNCTFTDATYAQKAINLRSSYPIVTGGLYRADVSVPLGA